jgi:hypothetical protein
MFRSLKLLCLTRNIENLSTIQEKSGYLLGQRGNERFVGFSATAQLHFYGKPVLRPLAEGIDPSESLDERFL